MSERLLDWLARWTPLEVIFLAGILGTTWVLLRALKTVRLKQELRARAEREAELLRFTQEMTEKGLAPEQIELLVKIPSPDAQEETHVESNPYGTLAKDLAILEAPAPVIEEVFTLVRGADPEVRLDAIKAVGQLAWWHNEGSTLEGDQVLAAVRGLCRPAAPPRRPAAETMDKILA